VLRSTALVSQPSETSRDVKVGDAYAARVPAVEDEDPSDILRRVQAGMSAARLSVPLVEQIEIVGRSAQSPDSDTSPVEIPPGGL
jgi:hypothetical protein